MSYRKGITLKMVGGIILALIGVAVLLGVFSDSVGGSFNSAFCTSYRGVSSVIPGSGPSPAGCQEKESDYSAVDISDPEDFKLELASAIINCWQKYKGFKSEEEDCQGWNVENLDGSVSKASLVREMEDNNLIPGQITEEQIEFTGSASNNIEEGDLIVIQYVKPSGENEKIQVMLLKDS